MALLHFLCIGQVSTMSWLIADIFWILKIIDMSRQEENNSVKQWRNDDDND